jgi:hypothetical protein
MSPPAEDNRAGQRFVGGCLLAVGLLIATLCGACTLLIAGAVLVSAFSQSGQGQLAMIVPGLIVPAIIGGIPTAVGVALSVLGWRMVRRPRPPPPPPENIFS